MALIPDEVKISQQCPSCELVQFRSKTGLCRRCGKELPKGSVASTTVVVLGGMDFGGCRPIHSMRFVMQRAAVEAVRSVGATTKAARALGIPHSRLKQLLRESGDVQDYRKDRKRRKQEA